MPDRTARPSPQTPAGRGARERADAIVIGAGAIGAAVALELARGGRATVVVDRNGAAGHGSTSDSASILRVYASTRASVAMAWESAQIWADWQAYLGVEDELGAARYVRTGTVLLKSAAGHHERTLPHLDALAIPYEDWDTDRLAARLPVLDVRAFGPPRALEDPAFWHEPDELLEGALFLPEGGYVNDAALAAHNLQRAAEARGARFRFHARVVDVLRRDGRVAGVALADGSRIAAPVVVNVAGPHSGQLNRLAGVDGDMRVETRPLRHELHVVPAPPGFDFEHDGAHVSDGDLGVNFRPETGNRILVGTEDPPCDPRSWVEDADRFEHRVTREQWERQVHRLARRIPDLPIPDRPSGVSGLYDVTPDWLPIYDRAQLDGWYMAVGTSGNQFKNAPVVGRLMAALVAACEDGRDHDREPLRLRLERTGELLDLGVYSRLREPSRETSLSVIG